MLFNNDPLANASRNIGATSPRKGQGCNTSHIQHGVASAEGGSWGVRSGQVQHLSYTAWCCKWPTLAAYVAEDRGATPHIQHGVASRHAGADSPGLQPVQHLIYSMVLQGGVGADSAPSGVGATPHIQHGVARGRGEPCTPAPSQVQHLSYTAWCCKP